MAAPGAFWEFCLWLLSEASDPWTLVIGSILPLWEFTLVLFPVVSHGNSLWQIQELASVDKSGSQKNDKTHMEGHPDDQKAISCRRVEREEKACREYQKGSVVQ